MKHYLLVMVCATYLASHSQNCIHTFFGDVKDFHDGTPISGATVYIETLNTYTTTDINGNFTIKNLCKGLLIVKISHIGCETKRIEIVVNDDTYEDIYMEHHIEELQEVTISGNTPVRLTKSAQEAKINSNILERYSSQNLGDALKQISGVSSINTGHAIVKPIINGLHSSRISIITNGVLLQDQEWGIEHAPNIDINSANNITVIKGASALAYSGDAVGGAIIIKPKSIINKDSLYGSTILGAQTNGRGYNLTTFLSKTWEKGWYVTAQGTLKRFGDFEAPGYNLTNTGLDSRALNVSTGYKTFEKGFNINYSRINNEIGILRAAHIGNINDLVEAINNRQPSVINGFSYNINAPRQKVIHQIIKADVYKRFKQFGRLQVQYDFQDNKRFEYDVRRDNDAKAAIDLNLKTHAIKADLKLDASTKSTYNFGIHSRYQNNFANPNTGVRRLIPDYDKYDIGLFAISEFNFNVKTNFDVGFRYDFNHINAKKFYQTSRWNERNYNTDFSTIIIEDFGSQLLTNPVFNFHNIAISTGLSYKINSKQQIRINYSLSQRTPNPAELFSDGLHHSAARIELGDLRIKQETSNRVGTSYTFENKKLSFNIDTYINSIKNFVQITPFGTEQTIRGAFPVWNYTQTNALLLGIDVSAQYKLCQYWQLNHTAAFIKGRDTKAKKHLIDMPAYRTTNALQYNNKKWLNFNTFLESEWVLRQNNYPNFNFETFNPTTQETVLVDISTPPPAYHLLNFRSSITVPISKKTNLDIALNVTNLLDTTYREYLNRLRYFADDLGRNFTLQLKLNY